MRHQFLLILLLMALAMLCGCSEDGDSQPRPEARFLWPQDGYVLSGPLQVEVEGTAVDSLTLQVGGRVMGTLSEGPFVWPLTEDDLPAGIYPLRVLGAGPGGTVEKEIWCGRHFGGMPAVGDPCPDFRLPDENGTVHLYSERRAGRPALLNFWAAWCPPCRNEMPDLQAIHDDYAASGFHVLGCSVLEDSTASLAYLRGQDLSFDFLIDHEDDTYIYFRINAIPQTFLLDAGGTIRHAFTGAIDPLEVRPLIHALLAEED